MQDPFGKIQERVYSYLTDRLIRKAQVLRVDTNQWKADIALIDGTRTRVNGVPISSALSANSNQIIVNDIVIVIFFDPQKLTDAVIIGTIGRHS